jgi:integrase
MSGHLRQRSPNSWELRYRVNGTVRTTTVKGSKTQAKARLRELLVAADRGEHVAPSNITVSQLVAERIAAWHAGGRISASTREAYLTGATRMAPIGDIPVQRLGSADVERWHLGMGRLSGSAKRSTHGLLARALGDAVRHRICTRNAAKDQGPPPAGSPVEVAMLDADQVAVLLTRLDDEWRVPVVTALYCGLRRSEQLALRWNRIDLDGAKMQIVEALEQAGGAVSIKLPKTRAGKRVISLPANVVEALRDHRRQQLERCLLLGLGRPPDDALVFPGPVVATTARAPSACVGGVPQPASDARKSAGTACGIAMPAC